MDTDTTNSNNDNKAKLDYLKELLADRAVLSNYPGIYIHVGKILERGNPLNLKYTGEKKLLRFGGHFLPHMEYVLSRKRIYQRRKVRKSVSLTEFTCLQQKTIL